jgi:hypothetical protein
MMITLDDIKWAAEECVRQHSGEMSVYWLCEGLDFVRDPMWRGTINDIQTLGRLIEPEKNKNGFRKVPVQFKDLNFAIRAENIDIALSNLIQYGTDLSPTEWYKMFQKVHPFVDGNGRVGAILFNVKNGTLKKPIAPPKVF